MQSKEGKTVGYTVIIPAHNEAATLGRCLRAVQTHVHPERARAETGRLVEVIVVCNGCTDGTAEVARAAAPDATVMEIPIAGKAKAVNVGLSKAGAGAVVVIDADVEINADSLAALADAVGTSAPLAASPAAELDLTGADPWVEAYYAVFREHDYLASGVGGSGVYALSEGARRRIAPFPEIISDDGYVRHLLSAEQQRRVSNDVEGRPVRARIRSPRRLAELVRSEARWRAGDAEVRKLIKRHCMSGTSQIGGGLRHLLELRRAKRIRTGQLIRYVLVKLAGRALLLTNRLSGRAGAWRRDTSSRI